MEHLWAPWRLEYIKSDKKKGGCILCNVQKDEKQSLVIYQGSLSFVVLNKYPYSTGHLMVCPNRHVDSLDKLTKKEISEMGLLKQKCISVLKDALHPMGFNIGLNQGYAAGAGIADHLHEHIVPRWSGDTNFMPIIGNTRVLSTYLEDAHKKLYPIFKGKRKK
ncbi:MAG TPA: HIT domain-containing protein [Bdellovibrionota bacterium]|nr:HIT domain-containing protein [Bdellovibrionota bacterium]